MSEDLKRVAKREHAQLKAHAQESEQFKRQRDRKGKLRMAETLQKEKDELQHRDKAMRAFSHKAG